VNAAYYAVVLSHSQASNQKTGITDASCTMTMSEVSYGSAAILGTKKQITLMQQPPRLSDLTPWLPVLP
jgi:hypothetical protein